jgi:hypothetical protein
MPKKVRRDKRGSAAVSTGQRLAPRRPDSVNELLKRGVPALTRVTAHAARANFWNEWLSERLPAEIRTRISGVVERQGALVIFAESAAWSARLRYLIEELAPQIRAAAAGISEVVVRVRPR